jgi:hypothetical protein
MPPRSSYVTALKLLRRGARNAGPPLKRGTHPCYAPRGVQCLVGEVGLVTPSSGAWS